MVRGFMVHSFEFGHPLFVLWHSTACLLGTTFILCVCIVVRSCETVVQTWDNRVLHLHLQHLERGRRWWLDLVPWSPGHFCRTLKQDLWEETGQTSLSWPLSSRTLGSKEQWQQRWAFQLWVHKTLCGGDVREEGREGGKVRGEREQRWEYRLWYTRQMMIITGGKPELCCRWHVKQEGGVGRLVGRSMHMVP